MKKILITGGAGFIGSHTADKLIDLGYHVRILDNLDPQIHIDSKVPDYLNKNVEFYKGDICNPDDLNRALKGINYIFHFVAETGVGQSMYEISKYFNTSVTGTAMLWEQIIKNKFPIEKVILSSSRAVYGEGKFLCENTGEYFYPDARSLKYLNQGDWLPKPPENGNNKKRCEVKVLPIDEKSKTNPVSIYGYNKLYQEQISKFIGKTYEIPYVILRYFNVFGPRQSLSNPYTGVIANFYTKLVNNNKIHLYEEGFPVRDFIYIDDVVNANIKSLNPKIINKTFNVGSGSPITIKEISILLSEQLNKSIDDIVSTKKFRVGDIYGFYADMKNSKKLLGFTPRFSVKNGLKILIDNWRNEIKPIDKSKTAELELLRLGLLGNNEK